MAIALVGAFRQGNRSKQREESDACNGHQYCGFAESTHWNTKRKNWLARQQVPPEAWKESKPHNRDCDEQNSTKGRGLVVSKRGTRLQGAQSVAGWSHGLPTRLKQTL